MANHSSQNELEQAYRRGDLEAVRSLSPNPEAFPNDQQVGPPGLGDNPLVTAIYHSPIDLIGKLLDMGADPNHHDGDGFPPLIAALSSEREDVLKVLDLLLDAGANIQQRGINDFTPLHWAARYLDSVHVQFLLDHGADPNDRTTIDDYTTPLEEAASAGRTESVALLEPLTSKGDIDGKH